MTIGVQSLAGRGEAGYLVYSGEVSCGARVRIVAFDKSRIVFQSIKESNGVRLGSDYYNKCNHVIRENGSFLGNKYGWGLDNDEWRIVFDRVSSEMEIYFDNRYVGKAPFQKIDSGA